MNTKLLRQRILDRIRTGKEELIKDKKLKRKKRDNQPIEEVPFGNIFS